MRNADDTSADDFLPVKHRSPLKRILEWTHLSNRHHSIDEWNNQGRRQGIISGGAPSILIRGASAEQESMKIEEEALHFHTPVTACPCNLF